VAAAVAAAGNQEVEFKLEVRKKSARLKGGRIFLSFI
jgi:hypothetical protein